MIERLIERCQLCDPVLVLYRYIRVSEMNMNVASQEVLIYCVRCISCTGECRLRGLEIVRMVGSVLSSATL